MKTRTKSRLTMALAALVMLPVFVTPLWTIHLTAPQYRDGLGMHIYVNDIRGHDRHDIQNINILNHYIGMQAIDPAEVPELEIMPVVLGGLIGTGLVVAAVGSPWLTVGWLGAFLVAGTAGMVDFYMWNIDYGHNLSPDAPIRIPDMTYSPPIIGTEQILNIRASSWPHLGTLFLTISALLAAFAAFLGFRARREEGIQAAAASSAGATSEGPAELPSQGPSTPTRRDSHRSRPSKGTALTALFLSALLAGCGGGEAPGMAGDSPRDADRIVYGESEDPYCGETVQAVRWGGELHTRDGDRLRFRSVECLAAYLIDGRLDPGEVAAVKVVDFPDGWKLIDVADATFLHTPNLSSPTKLNLVAIEEDKMVVNLQAAYDGELLDWEGVLALVSREWGVPTSASTGNSSGEPQG